MYFRKRDKKAGKPEIAKRKAEKLTAKQRALAHREEVFAAAQRLYETKNYIAVVGKRGTKYYAKNDENRAVAKKVRESYSDGRKGRRKDKKTGWSNTKQYPHKRHPAYFRKTGQDDIEYVTFTHSEEVDFDKDDKKKPLEEHDIVKTNKLNKNISVNAKPEDELSRVIPRVYEGKRSALGKGTNEYKLAEEDKPIIDEVFKTGKRYKVPHTGGKPKNKKPRK